MNKIWVIIVFVLKFEIVFLQEETIDLSWDFDKETVYLDGQQHFVFTKKVGTNDRSYWYSMNEFCAAEHGGTHFDAPYHFFENGWKVDDIPIERLFAKGALVNLTKEHELLGRNTRLTVEHLKDWEKKNGKFEHDSVLLVQFGRSKLWSNRKQYLDLDDDNKTMNFPGLSEEAAEWIAETGKFYGVGLDTPSIDPGNSTDYMVHRILAENSLFNLENVKLLDEIPEKGFTLVIAPMKIQDGTGAPVRIFAKLKQN